MTGRDSRPEVRRAQRILLMVHELHKLGYQKIRIAPGLSGSGCYWRCSITIKSNIQQKHGALLAYHGQISADYTSGMENEYFGWQDAKTDTARQLAVKFIERFPEVVTRGKGIDWEYAGWYVQMMGFAERGELPIAYADWYSEPDPRYLPTTKGFESGLPMPPGGEAEVS